MSTSSIRFSNVGNLGGFQGSDWTAYTPTLTGVGTASGVSAFWRRVGDSLQVQGNFTTGTVSGSDFSITLPTGLSIDTAKISGSKNSTVGKIVRGTTTASATPLHILVVPGTSTSLVYASVESGSSGTYTSKQPGNVVFGSTEDETFYFQVPIAGWSSTSPNGVTLNSEVLCYDTGGQGSTNDKVVIFTNCTTAGSDITRTTSATLGDKFLINTSGIYAVTYVIYAGTTQSFAISKNASGTTAAGSLAAANVLAGVNVSSNNPTAISWTGRLAANDYLYAHTSGSTATSDTRIKFTIVRVA